MGYIFVISSHLVISIFSLSISRALCFVEVFYNCLRRIIHSGCWHTATEFSGGAPPAMWESLGYCTIVVVYGFDWIFHIWSEALVVTWRMYVYPGVMYRGLSRWGCDQIFAQDRTEPFR